MKGLINIAWIGIIQYMTDMFRRQVTDYFEQMDRWIVNFENKVVVAFKYAPLLMKTEI
jgi:hypothetical protein